MLDDTVQRIAALEAENADLTAKLAAWEERRGDINSLVVYMEHYSSGTWLDCAYRVLDMLAPETAIAFLEEEEKARTVEP